MNQKIRALIEYDVTHEGLRSLLIAIENALQNSKGQALDESQLCEISKALMYALIDPMLTYDQAMGIMDNMETTGLCVDNPVVGLIADVLEDVDPSELATPTPPN